MQPNYNYWQFRFRPFKWNDLYTVQALINVIASDDNVQLYYSLEWLYFVLNKEDFDATQDCFVATLPTDRIIGFSRVGKDDNSTTHQVFAGVHPDFRGIGIGHGLIRVNDFNIQYRYFDQSTLRIQRQSPSDNGAAIQLLTHAGYQQITSDDDTHLFWEKTFR